MWEGATYSLVARLGGGSSSSVADEYVHSLENLKLCGRRLGIYLVHSMRSCATNLIEQADVMTRAQVKSATQAALSSGTVAGKVVLPPPPPSPQRKISTSTM